MSTNVLGVISVVDAATSREALARLKPLVAAHGPQLVIITSPMRDLITRPFKVLPGGGPDLKRLAADDGGDPPLPAVHRLLVESARTDVTILGPGAAAPRVDDGGSVLVLSALGPSAADRVAGLSDVGLHLDVGIDAFDGLATVATALQSGVDRWSSVVLLGLTPTDAALKAVLAFGGVARLLVWDPDTERVAAWKSRGVAATTSWPALVASLDPALPVRPVLISSSEALASIATRTLGLDMATELDEAAAQAIASELPAHVAVTAPLIIPEAPARPGLPPGHRRQISAAVTHLHAHGVSSVVVLADTDPALSLLARELSEAPHARCVAADGLAALAEGRRLVATAATLRHRDAPAEPLLPLEAPALEGLQTRLVASLVMRQRALAGREAANIAALLSGADSLPRVTAMSLGHVGALATKAGGPVVVGLEPAGLPRGLATPLPTPIRCESAAEAEAAFEALVTDRANPLAYEPRFVVTLPPDAVLGQLAVTRQPVASTYTFSTNGYVQEGHLHTDGTWALPAAVRDALRRIAALWDILDVVDTLQMFMTLGPETTRAHILDARIGLVGQHPASLPHVGRRFD